jgi:hypothetical protein
LIGELVRFDEVDIAENGFHPLRGQASLLLANEIGKFAQRARGWFGHIGCIEVKFLPHYRRNY